MPASPRRGRPSRGGRPTVAGQWPAGRDHATLHRARDASRRLLVRNAGLAFATTALVAALGGGESYWLCVPALLVAAAGCRTRLGTAIAAAVMVIAAALPISLRHETGARGLPSALLALLVPAASAAVLLAVRERLEAEREAMRRSAMTDPLTGVANRRSLLARVEYEISRHERARRAFGVVMLDLDGFKLLNDRYGHPAGDDLLREVAAAIAHVVRDQDTVARMGGDEFCVLAPETDVAGADQLLERVLSAVGSVTAGIDALGASAGAATFPLDGRSSERLLEAADQRLLERKRSRSRSRARRAA